MAEKDRVRYENELNEYNKRQREKRAMSDTVGDESDSLGDFVHKQVKL